MWNERERYQAYRRGERSQRDCLAVAESPGYVRSGQRRRDAGYSRQCDDDSDLERRNLQLPIEVHVKERVAGAFRYCHEKDRYTEYCQEAEWKWVIRAAGRCMRIDSKFTGFDTAQREPTNRTLPKKSE